ncbi:MAG TPA: nuclease-related domain-containing protein [Leptospiraceae bacterium]|nr:nuclease-related domain-containing protein [Leptospiraceae bacterium]HMY67723.1 nuclease-related domain-containing protein [Leptospiraceae bacterium]HMZ61695.1 nuclease-related domain-containing protein [Leptospiraceae bacterium]HNF13822.1 nuclease-related domain-containing protein [Leptospiraceae bacterium]HNF26335.1 nuclease-related domain-containing protein [Leptospiraceae bacterium]
MIIPSEYTEPLSDPVHGIKSGEKDFFYRFRDEISGDAVVFYSLILKFPGVSHREIDFLLINHYGVFIIELKNSQYRIEKGKWEFF